MTQRRYRLVRRPVRRVVRPVQEFIHTETSGGIVLLVASVLALAWANSWLSGRYVDLFEQHIVVDLGFHRVDRSLHFWVNEGLMVVFFFVVGLEIKRELTVGELASRRRAALPLAAAAGGMIVPAALFLLIAQGAEAREGWGVPVATDIAFALGVLALLGDRAPTGLKVLLLALAVFDDLGAVAVIAVFYTDTLEAGPLVVALALVGVYAATARLDGRGVVPSIAIALVAWGFIVESGVHPTVLGVALGFATPTFLHDIGDASAAERETEGGRGPVSRLEHVLHPWVAFAIVPLFALANAGVDVRGGVLDEALGSAVTWGVIAGLVVGKPAGILAGTWLARRAGAEWSSGVTWTRVAGMSFVAGIGFTVALFVAELAYEGELLAQAKIGVLAASLASGVLGYALLRRLAEPSERALSARAE